MEYNADEERLLDEQRKLRDVVSKPISEHEMDYFRNHPALKDEDYPAYLLEYQKDYPPFKGTEENNGKIILMIDE